MVVVTHALGEDTEISRPVLRLAMSFDELKFLGKNSNGIAEYQVHPRIELHYLPIDSSTRNHRQALTVPVSIKGDKYTLAYEGYQRFQLTDPEGVEVRCSTPEPVLSNAMMLLFPRTKFSCFLSNDFGAEVKREGVYRLTLRVVLTDDEGKKIEADVSGSFKIDAVPGSKPVK